MSAIPAFGRLLAVGWIGLGVSLPSSAAADSFASGPGYRAKPLSVTPGNRVGFARMQASATGIAFTNVLSRERYTTNQIHLNGSGVAAGDIDGDGWCDLYFCGLDGSNALYRNLGGWRFEEIAKQAGVECAGLDSTGAAFADLDGDGDLDLAVNTIMAGTHLFQNQGNGGFLPWPGAPLNFRRGGMSLALADIDGDSDLDLYVVNYRTVTVRDQPAIRIKAEYVNNLPVIASVDGKPASDPEVAGRFTLSPAGKIFENGEIDVLYRNDGAGKWTPISFTGGAFLDEDGKPLSVLPFDWGLSAMFRDINRDGAPDLYVCNDFRSSDRLWMNDGKGNFRAAPRSTLRHTSLFSMGVDFADLDRDGFDDFIVVDMLSRDYVRRQVQVGELAPPGSAPAGGAARPQFPHNTLFRNRGDGTFAEIAWYSGLEASEWSWTPAFLDVDLDGYEDLLVTNGHERDAMNADVMQRAAQEQKSKRLSPSELLNLNHLFGRLNTPNVSFRNRGNLTFEETSDQWGFNAAAVSHGLALADLDGDGDLDAAVNNLNDEAALYRNEAGAPRVAVRLKGTGGNRFGIGARITLQGGAVPEQSQEMMAGGRYLSSDEPLRVFAAGTRNDPMHLEIRWRNGKKSRIEGVRANHLYDVEDASGLEPATAPLAPPNLPVWFEDLSGNLGHEHHDDPFNEEARQPHLGKSLNRLGPGLAWLDVDGDGSEELVIGGGRGGAVRAFRYEGSGKFAELTGAPWNRPLLQDTLGLAGWTGVLVAVHAGYEDLQSKSGTLRIFDGRRKTSGESLKGETSSFGPMAMADLDVDGDLDLFVGGRAAPGRYPAAADSLLLRNDGGRLTVWQRFEKLGMVSGAIFTDLRGDAAPELVLACEWGPVRVFEWRDARLTEVTESLGLANDRGWWNGVAAGDWDGDGRQDLVVSNWGLNSRYRASHAHPLRLHYGELRGDGSVTCFETRWEPSVGRDGFVRDRQAILGALPALAELFPSFEAFGKSSVEQALSDFAGHLDKREVNTLASAVFLNRDGRLERRDLPPEAQWAPAFGVNVADADGDGFEDLFLSQNFFGNVDEGSRGDSGLGLWLRGDGKGGFRAVPATLSGVRVWGEQRGSAVGDFDGDGRVDLAVAQNGAATRLFRNTAARPGLRVRMKGLGANPAAVGTIVRVKCDGKWGPAREIRAGGGYLSQDSSMPVLSLPGTLEAVRVRWPGGASAEWPVAPGSKEIEIDQQSGQLRVVR